MQWQQYDKFRAYTLLALDDNSATILLNNLAGTGKADADPFDCATSISCTLELLEDVWQFGFGDTHTMIAHGQPGSGIIWLDYCDGDVSTAWAVYDGVREKIDDNPLQVNGIPYSNELLQVRLQKDLMARGRALLFFDDLLYHGYKVGGLAIKGERLSGLQAGVFH